MTDKTIEQIRENYDYSLNGSVDSYEQVRENILFAIEQGRQWDGAAESNRPMPEINKTFIKASRLHGSISRLNFESKVIADSNEATKKDAQNLQNLFRTDMNKDQGSEAKTNVEFETVFGGFGCTKLVSKYVDEESPDPDEQYICQEPIYMACECVTFSADGINKDKSDCSQSWHIFSASRKDIEEEYNTTISSFGGYSNKRSTDNLDTYINDSTRDVTLAHYYEVIEEKHKDFIVNGIKFTKTAKSRGGYKNEMGQELSKEDAKELKELSELNPGIEIKEVTRTVKYVSYSLLHGGGFLIKGHRMPFKRQPIIPYYAYYSRYSGREIFFGLVRLFQDPQRYFNYYVGALMDLLDRPQHEIPVFLREQVAESSDYWHSMREDNPEFLTVDPLKDAQGNSQPIGQISSVPAPQVGSAMVASGQTMDAALSELGASGQPTVPSNTSGEAISLINERQDDVYYPIVASLIQSRTASCITYIDAAKELYHKTPRSLTVTMVDGDRAELLTMQESYDDGIGYKNTARGKYTVETTTNQGFQSEQDQARSEIMEQLQYVAQGTPEYDILVGASILASTGKSTELARKYVRQNQIKLALANDIEVEPESEQEAEQIQKLTQQMAMAQQNPPEDPAMVLARAEETSAQAEMKKVQLDEIKQQVDAMLKAQELENEKFRLQIQAQESGANINLKNEQAISTKIDSMIKAANPLK